MGSTGSVLGGDHSDDVDISSPEPTVKRRNLLWLTVGNMIGGTQPATYPARRVGTATTWRIPTA